MVSLKEDTHISIEATEPRKRDNPSAKGDSKHQAVLAIDMASWKQLIDVFSIREPMIPHREEENELEVGGRGWYG
jgi:non-structural maintenance of chromosomes element 4